MKIFIDNFRRKILRKDGSAFVTVMILSAVLMIAGLSLTQLTSNASFTARKIHTGARALALAEAGIADQLTKMSTNSGSGYTYWAAGVSNVGTMDGGTYSVVVSTPAGQINHLVTSVGTVSGESRITVLELIREGTLDGALIAKGNITLDTSAMTINGDVYAGGNVYNSQGHPDVNGDINAAGGTIQVDGDGTENPNAPPIDDDDVLGCVDEELPYPIVPPFAAYSNAAVAGGLFYSASKTWNGEAINPPNGIVFVNGNASVTRRSSLCGIIVATGSISIDNQFQGITEFNTNWTVSLIAGYNVDCDNRNNFGGMIFAGNDIIMSNNRDIRGKLVALNNIYIRNRGVVTPPPSANSGNPQVVIGGWLR
ncbi:MAG: hypothetical protein A2283_05140 [Lentisphaerae bacterium RIFOXYA12_FULL_48_11]|nr:MAG: hypothetical protein A2283_05140 [Lentisphaerae bacterium RIFOXYA12_FULL_48_11]